MSIKKIGLQLFMPLMAVMFMPLSSCDEEEPYEEALVVDFDFTVDEINTLMVTFVNESQLAIDVSWDFGDGSGHVSAEESTTHTYSKGGQYTVILSGKDEGGLLKKVSREVIVTSPQTEAGFTFSTEANSLEVTFTNTSLDANTYTWDFGDGTVSDEKNPVHTFSGSGSYLVTLTAIDSTELFVESSYSEEVVLEILKANFTYTNAINSLTVEFSNTSEFAVSYNWDFGDGSALTSEENPTHTYSDAGTYRVVLTATDAEGFAQKDSLDITLSTVGFVPGLGDVYDFFTGDTEETNIAWSNDSGVTIEGGVDFSGDELDSLVGKYTRLPGMQNWNKIFFRPLPDDVDWSERSTFTIRVYLPSSNDYAAGLKQTVALRLRQDNSAGTGSDFTTEIGVELTVDKLDEWVTLTFNMQEAVGGGGAFDGANDYTTLIIQCGDDDNTVEGEFYLKDLRRL